MNKIIIAGASSGIGLALAEAFASRGVKVGVAARHLEPLLRLGDKYPGMVEAETMDITMPEAKAALMRLIKKMGGMDIYIHVAGIGSQNHSLDPELEVRMIDTDAAAFARMISCAYNYFRASGRSGRIAAVTSVAGTRGIGSMSAYSAAKACASTYLEALRQLARSSGVPVTITDIQPGWIRTPLLNDDKSYPLEMTIAQVVPLILRAIADGVPVAVIDWRWRIVKYLWHRLPSPLWTRMSGFGF